jgi:hypothetical protein
VDWIHVAQDIGWWQTLLKTVMNLQDSEKVEQLSSSQEVIAFLAALLCAAHSWCFNHVNDISPEQLN